MANKTAQQMEDLLTLYKTTLLDIPLAGTKLGLGMGQEREVMEAAWKGYDAWVRLANASVDTLYRNPLFGDVMARSLDRWLRWQRLSQAMAGTFFAALWPAVGLPTAAAVQALHEELSSLRISLKTQEAELRSLRTRNEEMRFLPAGLPAHSNGNGNGHNGTRTALHKKLTNGHATKNGRKTDVAHPLH